MGMGFISKKCQILHLVHLVYEGLLMGKLHDDMMFLDKIVNHPALQKNILILKEENQKSPTKDIDKVKNF